VITCVDSEKLDGSFCGRDYDAALMAQLPKTVDSCGENGEFHTFVYAGPIFKEEIAFTRGETILRDNRYYFCDLIG
jgi:diphthamide synthase (EF-2-diphthine--ammonia ligase)